MSKTLEELGYKADRDQDSTKFNSIIFSKKYIDGLIAYIQIHKNGSFIKYADNGYALHQSIEETEAILDKYKKIFK